MVIVGTDPAYSKVKYMKPMPPATPATSGSSNGAPSASRIPLAARRWVSSALSWCAPPPNSR
jgi:hypothetical protein